MEAFFKLIRNPFLFRFFLLTRLPAAFLAGLRLELITPARAVVKLRYQFLTKNPFRSTYFACLGMAAEMSTGLLAYATGESVELPVVSSGYNEQGIEVARFLITWSFKRKD